MVRAELMAGVLIQLSATVGGNLESFRKIDGSVLDANAIFKSFCVCMTSGRNKYYSIFPCVHLRRRLAFPAERLQRRLINPSAQCPCYTHSLG